MNKRLIALFLFVLLGGCERKEQVIRDKDTTVYPVGAEDAEMIAAMQTAREQFPDFWKEVSADRNRVIPALGVPMVKAYFFDRENPQEGEHMWVRDIRYDGKTLTGILVDTPIELHAVVSGEEVVFPLERLSDWLYVDGDMAVGAFTVNLLRSRMTDEERIAHDSHYPFHFE